MQPRLSSVISYAVNAHAHVNQEYGEGVPYAVHLSIVAMYAVKHNPFPEDIFYGRILPACWLHDTIEDCRKTYNDILDFAGYDIAEIVYALTNDKGRNRAERAGENYYAGIRGTHGAVFVKLCDRLANVRYSSDINSKMLDVYKREHEKFIQLLQPLDVNLYGPLLDELTALLK